MFVASLSKPKALQIVFFVLTLTFYALAIGDGAGIAVMVKVGGFLGLLTALCAFYLAVAEIINESHGRTILPIGEKA